MNAQYKRLSTWTTPAGVNKVLLQLPDGRRYPCVDYLSDAERAFEVQQREEKAQDARFVEYAREAEAYRVRKLMREIKAIVEG
jgi:hypothetical protein